MNEINKNEQWLLDGKCTMCRRNNYCKTPCKRCKDRQKYEINCHIAQSAFKTMWSQHFMEHLKKEHEERK